MNEFPDFKTLALWLGGLLMTLLGAITKRLHNRVDEHDRNHVTREELKETLREMRVDRLRMHQENREELTYIRERVDTIADRRGH